MKSDIDFSLITYRHSVEKKEEKKKKEFSLELSHLLKSMRTTVGMSQANVAEVLGLTRTSIINMERGRQRISLEYLDKLANKIGIELVISIRRKK